MATLSDYLNFLKSVGLDPSKMDQSKLHELQNIDPEKMTADDMKKITNLFNIDPQEIARKQQLVPKEKIGRNDPCVCGSDKKYKKCCGP